MKRAGKRKAGPTRTVQHTASGGPQLVWSGPEASGPPGNTRRVYEELFGSAKGSLVMHFESLIELGHLRKLPE